MEQRQYPWRYFKKADTVVCESIWGTKRFIVDKLYGNAWCPILDVHDFGNEKRAGNTCLLDPKYCKLVNASKRPLAKLKKEVLLKMLKNGNTEAKREFLIRNNNK